MQDKGMIVNYVADGVDIRLTPSIVRKFLTNGNPHVPDDEVAKFIMLCQARQLNPYIGDAYLIPRENKSTGDITATIIVGKQVMEQRAFDNPRYQGRRDGIVVVKKNGEIEDRKGTVYGVNTEKLVGGWCEVYVQGYVEPLYRSVSISEYNTGYRNWKRMPATMINKVAICQALRSAFPKQFSGLYGSEEMGEEEPERFGDEVEKEVIEVEPEGIDDEEFERMAEESQPVRSF